MVAEALFVVSWPCACLKRQLRRYFSLDVDRRTGARFNEEFFIAAVSASKKK
jgi:hypothetical protein